MRFMIPHGRKELPKDLEHVDLDNKANGLFVEIPLIDEITDRNIKIINEHISGVHSLLQLFDGRLASCSNDKTFHGLYNHSVLR